VVITVNGLQADAGPAAGHPTVVGRPRRSGAGSPWRRRRRAAIGVGVVIGSWAVITSSGAVNTDNIPTVAAVVHGAADSWQDLLSSLGATLESWALGLAIATVAGATLGLLVGLSQWADSATDVIVRMMRPLPSLALIPLAILVAGLGVKMTSGLVAFAAFWPVFINSRYAVRQIEPRLLDSGRVVGLGRWGLIRRVVIPATAPAIATGVRISVSLAIVVTVSVELVVGTGGLGGYVLAAEQSGATGQMYAGVVMGGILGWVLNLLFLAAARVLMPWQAAVGRGLG
jgi:NitT/TauT family transport system permease protein